MKGRNMKGPETQSNISGINHASVRDAELFLLENGAIVNTEGWAHPQEMILGEVMYLPDERGNKRLLGNRYRKATLHPHSYDPIPYSERERILGEFDPRFIQSGQNPFYARYKQFVPKSEVVALFSGGEALATLLTRGDQFSDTLSRDIESLESSLGIKLSQNKLGVTGSLSLGNTENIHDFDLVINEGKTDNREIARRIRELVREFPDARVIEGGKGWNIRYYNEQGTLMCCFFGYDDAAEIALKDFSMEVIEDDIQIEGSVSDDIDGVYTPTVLRLADVKLSRFGNTQAEEHIDIKSLIVYHTASRGECFEQDRIKASGALVNVTTPQTSYLALCAIERDAVRNLTPTWQNFYTE